MELDFSFAYIKNLPQQWKALEPADLRGLRQILFPKEVIYNYPGFQTPEICVILQLNQLQQVEKDGMG